MKATKIIWNVVIAALKDIRRRIASIKTKNAMNVVKKATSEKFAGVRITTLLATKARRKLKRKRSHAVSSSNGVILTIWMSYINSQLMGKRLKFGKIKSRMR